MPLTYPTPLSPFSRPFSLFQVQELLISHVYLDGTDGANVLLSRFSSTSGEKAYVILQMLMAEHQSDPLISQYVGGAMMKVLEKAGLNKQTIAKEASSQ